MATGTLTPFRTGDPRTVEAARKGGQTRARNAAARKAATIQATGDAADYLDGLRQRFNRDTLGDDAAVIAGHLLARIGAGQIPVRNGSEAADLLRVLVDVARIEAGEPTSLGVVGHLSSREVIERVEVLRRQAVEALTGEASAAALAVADGGVVVVGGEHPSPVVEAVGEGGGGADSL